jgi:hypothetical protein
LQYRQSLEGPGEVAPLAVDGGAFRFGITEQTLNAARLGDLDRLLDAGQRLVFESTSARDRCGHHQQLD